VKFVVTAGPTSQTAILTYDQLSTAQQLLNTCAVVLKSNSTLEEVIYEYKIPLSVEQMEKCIEIKGIDETEVLSLTVSDTSAQRAADIANAIASIAPEKLVKTVKASSVEVISSAQVNGRPVSPNILLYTLVTFAFGIILGITASFLIEMLNDTFTTETSIERYLGIPVLGTIPHIKVK
jgi:capsular polysaccharide biosynthesis protein